MGKARKVLTISRGERAVRWPRCDALIFLGLHFRVRRDNHFWTQFSMCHFICPLCVSMIVKVQHKSSPLETRTDHVRSRFARDFCVTLFNQYCGCRRHRSFTVDSTRFIHLDYSPTRQAICSSREKITMTSLLFKLWTFGIAQLSDCALHRLRSFNSDVTWHDEKFANRKASRLAISIINKDKKTKILSRPQARRKKVFANTLHKQFSPIFEPCKGHCKGKTPTSDGFRMQMNFKIYAN